MSNLLVCRACLACNVPVYDILHAAHTRYQNALERITSISITEASRPHTLCAPCLEVVDKCCKLQEKSAAAEALLTTLLHQNQLTEEKIKSIDRQQHKLVDLLPNFTQLVPMRVNEEVQRENVMVKIEPLDTQTQDFSDVPEQAKSAPSQESPNHKVSIETVKVRETPYIQIDPGNFSAVKTEVDDTYIAPSQVSLNHKVSIETVKVRETPYIQIDAAKLSAVKTEVDHTYIAPSQVSPNHKVSIETVKMKETPYIQIDAAKLSAVKTEVDDTYIADPNVPDSLDDGLLQIEVEMAQTEYNAILKSNNRVKDLMIENARGSKIGEIGKKTAKLKNKSDVEAYLKKCSIDNRRLQTMSCGKCETKCEHKPLVKSCQKQATGENYGCSECDYQTFSRKNLMYHMKKHTDNLVICAICGYKCATKSRLVSHIRIHTKERPYECKICGKKFSEPGSLSKHLNYLHKGLKAFKCMWCDYGAATKSHLDRHIQRHTGDKRWKCELCDYACVQKWDLKRHVKTHENDRMRYKRVAPVIVRIVSMAEEK